MKFFSKINRGLVLLIILVLGVAIFLVIQSNYQSRETPKIKEVCQQYINTVIDYKQLPQHYRKANPEIPQNELEKHIQAMTDDIKAFYTDNVQTYKTVIKDYKSDLENQARGIGVVYNYKKEIKDYENIIFNGDNVTVSIITNSVREDSELKQRASSQTTDTISLQKVNGQWKVIYADLLEPMQAIEEPMLNINR